MNIVNNYVSAGRFKQTLLTISISAALMSGAVRADDQQATAPAVENKLEVISVKGIRGSAQRAMDVKRESNGIVDAISAEDIGKFPDTNLAESLQRISGVSISRSNGEGSQITVRGFGGSNNMVTLNGRTMPTGGVTPLYQDGTIGRAFDFGNLASEGVSGVEVYKTGKASIASGGIGATVNIITSKPINSEGFNATLGGKLVHDTTNEVGEDITPELSGLVSYTNDDNTFGISLSASHQVRDSGQTGATENNWNIRQWGAVDSRIDANTEIINAPEAGKLYALPNDLRYHFVDAHRVRDNSQLTLQFRPMESLTATVDYTFAKNKVEEQRGDKTIWLQGAMSKIVFDDNADIAGPLLLEQEWNFPKDNSYAQTSGNATNQLDSLGFNLEFLPSDRLTLNLDVHESTLEGQPEEAYGSALRSGMAVAIGAGTVMDFSRDLPKVTNTIDDSVKGNNNGIADIGDVGSTVFDFTYARQEVDVSEVRFDAKYDFETFSVLGGIERRSTTSAQQQSSWQKQGGGNAVAFPGDIPDELISDYDYIAGFDSIDTDGYDGAGFRADAVALATWAAQVYGSVAATPWTVAYNPNLSTNTEVEEETTAAFVQFDHQTELFEKAVTIVAGVRYEQTDVTSTNNMLVPTEVTWTDNNDFSLVRSSESTLFQEESDYSNVLPSIDVMMDLTDDMKIRASYGTTISRVGYGSLTSGATINNLGGLNLPTSLGGIPQASSQNPSLKPLESDNLDLSVEYYFDDASYVAVGYFYKDVENFIGNEQVLETQFGLRDATAGPRAQQAIAALENLGVAVNEDSLFVMTAILDNPDDFPNGAADFKTPEQDPLFWSQVATNYDISPVDADPELMYLTTKPINNRKSTFDGFELAAQHFFGETGFGVFANYTIVNGDTSYNNAATPTTDQFALGGLSDSANLVLMYEQELFSVRVAYNWRDQYLDFYNSTNPRYVESYSQIDVSASYNLSENFALSLEGINVTGEDTRTHGRSHLLMFNLYDLGPRYQIGARYTF